MNDLISWLRTQLDADERKALAARSVTSEPWQAIAGTWGPQVRTERGEEPAWSREIQSEVWRCDDEEDGCPDIARGVMAEAEHIANNDPARFLRQVQAHRAILAAYDDALSRRQYYDRDGEDPWFRGHARGEAEALEGVIKRLASIYSDRDGYKEEWSA